MTQLSISKHASLMPVTFKLIAVLILTLINTGCAGLLDRADRLREIEFDSKTPKVAINVFDATRRLAVVTPDGRTCSELSPPVVLEVDKKGNFSAQAKTPDAIEAGIKGSSVEDQEAVKLTTTNEAIDCLRISLFNACGLSSDSVPFSKVTGDGTSVTVVNKADLYLEIIKECNKYAASAKK